MQKKCEGCLCQDSCDLFLAVAESEARATLFTHITTWKESKDVIQDFEKTS